MSHFLETLKVRASEAREKLRIAKEALDIAQQAYNRANSEHAAWTAAIQSEVRRGVPEPEPLTVVVADAITITDHLQISAPCDENAKPDLSKTDIIRNALMRRPSGLTPGELWRIVEDEIPNRSYVYSVLQRLKERKEVRSYRGKYYPRIEQKPEEALEQELEEETIVQ